MNKDLRTRQQAHLKSEYNRLRKEGCTRFDFKGGRRSGKTYFILQRLLGLMYKGYVVSVATMTDTQGRLGAYQDAKDILMQSPSMSWACEILTNPREIRCKTGGRMFFNSYANGERAKGIACDYLYINEANNFTEQQYLDLAMSVRRAIFADRNPSDVPCWTERNGFALIHSTWQDNRAYLTDAQIAEFEKLKDKAEADGATAADIALYRRYYLGEDAEINGSIFTKGNIQTDGMPEDLTNYFIYADPSAMCGADYFAMVLVAFKEGLMYVPQVWSRNVGSRIDVADKMREWCTNYDVRAIYIEGNGLTGKTFYEEQRGSFPNMRPYTNTDNKHGRILGNYESLCSKVVFNTDAPGMQSFLEQIYSYEGKNSMRTHDDNIDAVNSAYEIAHRKYRFV